MLVHNVNVVVCKTRVTKPLGFSWPITKKMTHLYRIRLQLSDLGFVCFLPKYCFDCFIMFGQVGIRLIGHITLAMVEKIKSESTKNSHYPV